MKEPAPTSTTPLSKLERWDRNYRVGDVDAIIASIVRFGFNGAVRVWEGGRVMAGNHSLIALETMHARGTKPPQGIMVRGKDWLVPTIDVSHLSKTEATAFALADNRTQELGRTDVERLAELLQELAGDDGGLEGTGYNESDLQDLLNQIKVQAAADLDDPEVADPDAPDFGEVRPKLGDVWILGEHRLICGDCTDPAVLAGFGPFDLLWTDPPYGVDYVGKTAESLTIANDGLAGLDDLLRLSLAAVDTQLRAGASFYISHAAGPNQDVFAAAVKRVGWKWHQSLVWVKSMFALGHSDYHYRHEPLLYGWKGGAEHTWKGGRDKDTVLMFDKPNRNAEHPTMKPIDLVECCVLNSSEPNAAVVDIFGGSGTTLAACQRTGRRATVVELDPRYCEVILRRWEEMTGEVAETAP